MPSRDLGFYLNKASQAHPTTEGYVGQSGYFSAPQASLDTHIFGQDNKLLPDVRASLINYFMNWCGRVGYKFPTNWTKLFLAGSGASYQWAEARGNGDLDILLGFDYVQFVEDNPQFQGLSESDVADYVNAEMHADLWPTTANTDFNGQVYEVTYYLNPHTGMDIRNIQDRKSVV